MRHDGPTHVDDVSSGESMFEPHCNKGCSHHVRSNMAKATLNMMTQTLANEFIHQQARSNAVDPGYLSHQHSLPHNWINGMPERETYV
jgi:NAD(P)-dependent dehydrogenase (short-subunit alcohol dehydrogenase family)